MPYYSHLAGIAKFGKYLQSQGHDVCIAIPPQLEAKLQSHRVNQIATKILLDAKLRKAIETFKPDLILLDSHPAALMLTLIPYKLNIPFVTFGSFAYPQRTRTPILPTVIPWKLATYTDQMTFVKRVSNTVMNLLLYRRSLRINSSLINEYLQGEPCISLLDLQA